MHVLQSSILLTEHLLLCLIFKELHFEKWEEEDLDMFFIFLKDIARGHS